MKKMRMRGRMRKKRMRRENKDEEKHEDEGKMRKMMKKTKKMRKKRGIELKRIKFRKENGNSVVAPIMQNQLIRLTRTASPFEMVTVRLSWFYR